MKKIVAFIVAVCLVMAMGITAFAERPVKLYVGGEKIVADVEPKIVDGRTMLPLRAVFEAIGADVAWEDATQTVTATKGDTVVKLTIGSNIMTVNGTEKTLDVAAYIENNRTMVPVRACAEAFELKVDWFDATHTVKVRKEVAVPAEVFFADGEPQEKYTYDERGNCILYENTYGFHKGDDNGWIKYAYDENDNLIHWEDSNGGWSNITYDKNGNAIAKESYDFGVTIFDTYEYDENNNLIYESRKMIFDGNESETWKKYSYSTFLDGELNPKVVEWEDNEGNMGCEWYFYLSDHNEIRYEENGEWVMTELLDKHGMRQIMYANGNSDLYSYIYDINGNLIQKTEKKSYGEFFETYTYDENNRLIQSENQNHEITKYITVVR